jgi:3-hydroxybutyryl-CoA dehydrogenase
MRDKRIVAILGAGLMGAGIATRFARAGYETRVHDVNAASLARLHGASQAILDELAEAGQVDPASIAGVLAALHPVGSLSALAGASLVIEAIPERLPLKLETYAALEPLLAADAIIASNTSGFPPDVLSASLKHPERFLIAHFWNPPHLIPLVEMVAGVRTTPAVVEETTRLLKDSGAAPVLLNKAVPGFIGNRLQYALLREAMAIVQAGVASAEVVDEVMKASLGRRWSFIGPLEGADLGGLDTFVDIATHLMPELAADQKPLEVMRALASAGKTGAKAGQGFYEWTEERHATLRQKRIAQLRKQGSS